MRKNLEILSFYTCLPQISIIGCMVPEIWSMTDRIFCYFEIFLLFFFLPPLRTRKINILKKWRKKPWRHYYFTYVYHKWKSYDVWFLRYGVRQTEFFVILGHFLPFAPMNYPENENFENMKKHLETSSSYTSVPKIIIICNTVPEIWHVTDVISIFHFGLFFAHLPP